jgi:hypothetical protein
MVLAIRNDIGTQLNSRALIPKSIAILGYATLVALSITGVANAFSRIIDNRMLRFIVGNYARAPKRDQ